MWSSLNGRTLTTDHDIVNKMEFMAYIDLAKPKSGASRLFILTACKASKNKRFRICLRFDVSGCCFNN